MLDPATRQAVDANEIEIDDRTASVSFTVAEGEEIPLSLAACIFPDGEFSSETADEQTLVDASNETFGPGEHTLGVNLPNPGAFSASAFLGEHEVTVDGEETTQTVSVQEPSNQEITV